MTNKDLDSIILSDAVQEALNEKKEAVPLPKCRCCKRFSSTCEERKAALKEVADLRAVQEVNRTSAEAIKAVFAEAVATQPATPENISTHGSLNAFSDDSILIRIKNEQSIFDYTFLFSSFYPLQIEFKPGVLRQMLKTNSLFVYKASG